MPAFEECQALFKKVPDEWGIALALSGLGLIASQQGDYATARAQLEASRTLWQDQSDKWSLGDVLCLLGEVVQRQGELEQARDLYAECLLVSHDVGDKTRTALMLHHLGRGTGARTVWRCRTPVCSGSSNAPPLTAVDWFTLTDSDDYER